MRHQPTGIISWWTSSVFGLPDLVASHMEPVSLNFWINCRTVLRCGTLVSGNCAWNCCWTSCVYSPPYRNTCSTRNVRSSTDNTITTTNVFLASLLGSFCPRYHGRWLKMLKILYFCVFLYCNDQVHRDFLITRYVPFWYGDKLDIGRCRFDLVLVLLLCISEFTLK